MRRYESGIGYGACGRGRRNPAPGQHRAPPGGNKTPRQELADGAGGLCPLPKARPVPEDAAMERREAPAFLATGTRQD
jgi:hypothetical protein